MIENEFRNKICMRISVGFDWKSLKLRKYPKIKTIKGFKSNKNEKSNLFRFFFWIFKLSYAPSFDI